MDLSKVLIPQTIAIGMSCDSKQDAMQKVANLAVTAPALKGFSPRDIFLALDEREKLSSTGFGDGIAIPHCKLDCPDFVIGFIIPDKPVDFDAMDNKPVNIIAFMVAPEGQRDMHIRYLSALAGLLNNDLNKKKILAAKKPDDLKGIVLRHLQIPEDNSSSTDWNQLTFIVQSEYILDKVLGILTEVQSSNITVIDGNSPSYYLYSKPLFSSLWGNTEDSYCKVIIAIIPRQLANEILRKANNLISREIKEGLIVSMHELNYLAGKLNI